MATITRIEDTFYGETIMAERDWIDCPVSGALTTAIYGDPSDVISGVIPPSSVLPPYGTSDKLYSAAEEVFRNVDPTSSRVLFGTTYKIHGVTISGSAASVSGRLITSITPAGSETDEYMTVILTCTQGGLTGASGVYFENTPAISFTVDSDTQITAVMPMLDGGFYPARVE